MQNYTATVTMSNVAVGAIPSVDSLLVTVNVVGPNDNFTLKGYAINNQ